jgi:hypothetical protein
MKLIINRGIKQGCPLSPILFDICVNPLIEKLNSSQFKEIGLSWDSDAYLIAQVYADDILLFSNIYEISN